MNEQAVSNLFYRNPRLLILAVGFILVAGLSSYYVLPRLEDPLLTERAASISTFFPGADAERVESLVTEKLEKELREIKEIKELWSSSRAGVSTITIELRGDIYEVDSIWSRVRGKLEDAAPGLPTAATVPEFEQLDVKAYALIVALQWTQDTSPNYAILRRLTENLEDRLRAIRGTDEVDTFGDPDEEVVVEIRSDELVSLGLTAAEVARQIESSDAKVSAGQLRGAQGDLILEVDGELDTLARIDRTPICVGGEGQFVQLADFASVRKGIADPPGSLAIVDGCPAVALGVLVRPNHRLDHWSRNAAQVLVNFDEQLPRGVDLSILFEQNRYVETRLTQLLLNLVLSSIAVVAVVLVMMGWQSALLVGAALPLTSLMVFTGMRILDIPIHQMSITGLVIALGLLIDNAIIIVDEVSERLRDGTRPEDAVSDAVRHLAVPLFGSTLTTALAFAPIATMPGPAGEFVGAIAVSVILAITSSFALAMTVVPALTALMKRAGDSPPAGRSGGQFNHDGRRFAWWQDGFSNPRVTTAYRDSLDWVFRHPGWGIVLGVILPILGFMQAGKLSEQFFPPADRDQIQVELELPSHASLAATLATATQVRERMLAHDKVKQVHWFLGESAPTFYYNIIPGRKNTAHYAQALVQLRNADGVREVIRQLQARLNDDFPGARLLVRQLEQGPPFGAPIEVRLFGPDLQRLRELGDELRGVLAQTPDVIHTRSELSEAVPKLALSVDEEQSRLAGIDHGMIARQLNSTLEGAVGGSVLEATEELPVRVRVSAADRGQLDRVASIDLMPAGIGAPVTADYRGVPLSAIADINLEPQIAAIPRINNRRMNEVQAFITAGVLPAVVLDRFEQRLAAIGFELPSGYSFEYCGEAAKRDEAIGDLKVNAGVLLVLMIATLVLSFSSFRLAALIASVAALSVGLGLGALWLFGYPFGFMAIVGTMGLIGVAINDAIVVIAALRSDPLARLGDPKAVRAVVTRSTRHVVATSLTTIAGFTPLVIAGGGFWPPLAVAIAGGVGGATILALYYVPSVYILSMRSRCFTERAGKNLAHTEAEMETTTAEPVLVSS